MSIYGYNDYLTRRKGPTNRLTTRTSPSPYRPRVPSPNQQIQGGYNAGTKNTIVQDRGIFPQTPEYQNPMLYNPRANQNRDYGSAASPALTGANNFMAGLRQQGSVLRAPGQPSPRLESAPAPTATQDQLMKNLAGLGISTQHRPTPRLVPDLDAPDLDITPPDPLGDLQGTLATGAAPEREYPELDYIPGGSTSWEERVQQYRDQYPDSPIAQAYAAGTLTEGMQQAPDSLAGATSDYDTAATEFPGWDSDGNGDDAAWEAWVQKWFHNGPLSMQELNAIAQEKRDTLTGDVTLAGGGLPDPPEGTTWFDAFNMSEDEWDVLGGDVKQGMIDNYNATLEGDGDGDTEETPNPYGVLTDEWGRMSLVDRFYKVMESLATPEERQVFQEAYGAATEEQKQEFQRALANGATIEELRSALGGRTIEPGPGPSPDLDSIGTIKDGQIKIADGLWVAEPPPTDSGAAGWYWWAQEVVEASGGSLDYWDALQVGNYPTQYQAEIANWIDTGTDPPDDTIVDTGDYYSDLNISEPTRSREWMRDLMDEFLGKARDAEVTEADRTESDRLRGDAETSITDFQDWIGDSYGSLLETEGVSDQIQTTGDQGFITTPSGQRVPIAFGLDGAAANWTSDEWRDWAEKAVTPGVGFHQFEGMTSDDLLSQLQETGAITGIGVAGGRRLIDPSADYTLDRPDLENLSLTTEGDKRGDLRGDLYDTIGDLATTGAAEADLTGDINQDLFDALRGEIQGGQRGLTDDVYDRAYAAIMRPYERQQQEQLSQLRDVAQQRGTFHSGYLGLDEGNLAKDFLQIGADEAAKLALESERMGRDYYSDLLSQGLSFSDLVEGQARGRGAEDLSRAGLGADFLTGQDAASLALEQENRLRGDQALAAEQIQLDEDARRRAEIRSNIGTEQSVYDSQAGASAGGINALQNLLSETRTTESADAALRESSQGRIDQMFEDALRGEQDYRMGESELIRDEYQAEWRRRMDELLSEYSINTQVDATNINNIKTIMGWMAPYVDNGMTIAEVIDQAEKSLLRS